MEKTLVFPAHPLKIARIESCTSEYMRIYAIRRPWLKAKGGGKFKSFNFS